MVTTLRVSSAANALARIGATRILALRWRSSLLLRIAEPAPACRTYASGICVAACLASLRAAAMRINASPHVSKQTRRTRCAALRLASVAA